MPVFLCHESSTQALLPDRIPRSVFCHVLQPLLARPNCYVVYRFIPRDETLTAKAGNNKKTNGRFRPTNILELAYYLI